MNTKTKTARVAKTVETAPVAKPVAIAPTQTFSLVAAARSIGMDGLPARNRMRKLHGGRLSNGHTVPFRVGDGWDFTGTHDAWEFVMSQLDPTGKFRTRMNAEHPGGDAGKNPYAPVAAKPVAKPRARKSA